MKNIIDFLQRQQLVWKGGYSLKKVDAKSTGFKALDDALSGGFMATGVIEILSEVAIGELRLLLPSINKSNDKLLVFICPPGNVNAQLLSAIGFDINSIIILSPKTQNEALWASELCLQSGCCNAVLFWSYEGLAIHHIKRLQVASEKGKCQQFILRNNQHETLSLPVDLRLSLTPSYSGLTARIDKQKRGWPSQAFNIDMESYWPSLVVKELSSNIIYFPTSRVS